MGWVIPPDSSAEFVAAMENVLDVYRRPCDASHPVVCMNETPRQLIGQTRESIPASPGRPVREDYEYERLGVCNVFMANEPLAGRRITKVTERKTKIDWAHFIDDIDALRSEVAAWQSHRDHLNAKIDWQFTTDKARVKLKRLYSTFQV